MDWTLTALADGCWLLVRQFGMPVMKERIPHTQSGKPADDCHNVAMMPSLIRPPHPTDPRRSCTLPWFWMVHHPSHGCTSHAHTLASSSPPLPGDYNVYMWLVEYTRSLHTYYYVSYPTRRIHNFSGYPHLCYPHLHMYSTSHFARLCICPGSCLSRNEHKYGIPQAVPMGY